MTKGPSNFSSPTRPKPLRAAAFGLRRRPLSRQSGPKFGMRSLSSNRHVAVMQPDDVDNAAYLRAFAVSS